MRLDTIKQDLLASVVVFLVALPLCMGIAIASGAPPAAGLITGIVGGILVGAFSGCPLQVSGPAAGLAVLVFDIVQKHGLKTLGVAVAIGGLFQIGAALLRAGRVFRSISPSVIYGMLAGIGVLIVGAQFHVMIDDKPRPGGLENLMSIPVSLGKALFPAEGTSHQLAALIGVVTIVIIVLWTKFAPAKFKWVPGALIAVAVSTIATSVLNLPIRKVDIADGFLGSITFIDISTLPQLVSPELLVMAATLAFVASAETLLSAAAVDQMQSGPKADYNRELLSQGVGNTLCGLMGALPMTGVIVRSAANVNAGAKTRLSAMLHGVWLLVLVASVPWLLRMVPTASLAAVLVYTGFKLVNVQNVKRLLRYGGAPVVIYAATLIGIIATDLLKGILLGIGLSILKVVYARTHFNMRIAHQPAGGRTDVYLEGAASFLRLPILADQLESLSFEGETHIHLIGLDYVDDACLEALGSWQKQRNDKGGKVFVEWDEALKLYRDRNPLGSYQQKDIQITGSGGH